MVPAADMPAAEVEVDEGLVRALLEAQHPDLADLPIRLVAFGWDNSVFRLGDDLVVRLPRRQMGATLIEHEQRWLPTLAPRLPLPVPAPLRIGVPAEGFPWRWSICPWFEGELAARADLDRDHAVATLASFLRALHVPAPIGAPGNIGRGVPLAHRSHWTERHIEQLADVVDAPAVSARWQAALAVPPWESAPVWQHGDLHPANMLAVDGRLSAVIDFGDMNAGDPAGDLSVAWMLFPPDDRLRFRELVGVDDATWARAEGWALALGLAFLSGSADNALIASIGRRTLAAALGD